MAGGLGCELAPGGSPRRQAADGAGCPARGPVRPTWGDALAVSPSLDEVERGALLLLARLPLAPARALVPLLAPRRAVDAALARLQEVGLTAAVLPPPMRARRRERLWYLTDFGLGVVALDRGIEPRSLAERLRLRRADLRGRLECASAQVATYDLLAALATACVDPPT